MITIFNNNKSTDEQLVLYLSSNYSSNCTSFPFHMFSLQSILPIMLNMINHASARLIFAIAGCLSYIF